MNNRPEYGVLTYIKTDDIRPHKDNPRKDIGDVSELAESIKVNGVLQNLTVVPIFGEITGDFDGKYTVVIGHRRLAAAKLAGLETVPCIVSEMTGVKQIRTMLTENMQRTDLTVYEQAQGFQMMLDLGDSVADISERTGFSATTVRRRVKLLELDPVKLKKAEKRGATLLDFVELEKIEDPALKDSVLDTVGTENFRVTLKTAIDRESNKKRLIEFEAAVSEFAEKIDKQGYIGETAFPMDYVRNYGRWTKKTDIVERPEDADTVRYFYRVGSDQIDVFKQRTKRVKTEEELKRESVAREVDDRTKELQAITERHFNLRMDFVRDLKGSKKLMQGIAKIACAAIVGDGRYGRRITDPFMLEELLDLSIDEEIEYAELLELLYEKINEKPEYALLAIAYSTLDRDDHSYFMRRWNSQMSCYEIEHKANETLDRIYGVLESMGYETSDEEYAMQNGSHKMFRPMNEEAPDETGQV